MTRKQANNDKNFEYAPPNYILQAGDRMRRTNPESASSLDWFPVADFDVGKPAKYFSGSGFAVEKRKELRKLNQAVKPAKPQPPKITARLIEARENLKWTQAQLAKATGLQPSAVSHFEVGSRLPSLTNAIRLAEALRVSLDWLTGRSEGPCPQQAPVVVIDGIHYHPAPQL